MPGTGVLPRFSARTEATNSLSAGQVVGALCSTPIVGCGNTVTVRVDGPTSREPLWLEAVRRPAEPDAAS